MSGDILVVVGNRDRRVAVARHLTGCGHRVTISSSIDEAQEILQFITHRAAAPEAVEPPSSRNQHHHLAPEDS